VSEERQKNRRGPAGKFERRGGNDRGRFASGESASQEIRSQLPLLEKAFSQGDFAKQKVPLEEILKQLRPLHLTSIGQLDFSTRGRLMTTLLRVGRQPPPAAQVAQPIAEAPAAPEVSDSTAAEPSGDVAVEAVAEVNPPEPHPPVPTATDVKPPGEAASAYADVMFLLGLTWRALGEEQRAAPVLAASGRSEDKAPAASGRSTDQVLTASGRPANRAPSAGGRPAERVEGVHPLHKLGNWREEAQLLEGQKQTRNAARLHERHQSYLEAVRLYELAGDLLSALRSALAAKDSASGKRLLKKIPIAAAKPLLEKAKGYDWLMEHYVEAGDFQSVARLYERARQFDQAALAWERGGSLSNARKAYESAKDSSNARRVRALEVEELVRRGDRLGAAALLLGEGRKDQAVEILLGLPAPKAFRFLQKLKLDEEALALARKQIQEAESNQKPSEAARWLEWVGDFLAAAQAWEKADRKDKALAMYEQVGQWQRAGELAEALGQKEKAVDFYHRAGGRPGGHRQPAGVDSPAGGVQGRT